METLPVISAEVEDASYVSPPPGSVPATSLPITFFDMIYLVTLPRTWMQRLFFYESKHPISHFMETILPDLKTSLSRTLQHFFPFAGNVVFPPPPRMPYINYEEGDSVSLVVTKSTADFNHLVGDHARDQLEFQALVPKAPLAIAVSLSNDCKQEPAMAIQITVFPDVGFSIGVGFSHVVADGSTFAHFMKSWASIHSHSRRENSTCLHDDYDYLPCRPYFDRDLIKDPLNLESILTERTFRGTISPVVSINNLRVTYKLKRSEVELLKNRLKTKCSIESIGSDQIRMSTFVASCAYMWVCLIKSQQIDDSDAISYFHFPANCRDHLKLPESYFGNCLILRLASAKKCELSRENGIVVAATAIGREIMKFRQRPFEDAQVSLPKIIENNRSGKDTILAISSSKFGLYDTDFGYGRPRKTELGKLTSFGTRSMICIAESREEEGGVEFGLAFASHELDSFNAVFMEGLLNLQHVSVN